MQKELFDQAKTSASSSVHPNSDDDDQEFSHHSYHHHSHQHSHHLGGAGVSGGLGQFRSEEEMKLGEYYLAFLLREEGERQEVSPDEVVEFLVRESESRLLRFL